MRVGLVGGTGWTPKDPDAGHVRVDTPFGPVDVHVAHAGEHVTFRVHRHASADASGAHVVPPHRINHKANVWALAACRVDRVIALVSTGALRADVPVPGLLVPDDFIDASAHPHRSFHDDAPVHVAFAEPYCPVTRWALLEGAADAGAPARNGGVYAAVPGPRLETPAEVRALARDAHVVGMTGCPEAALAREMGLCYAPLALVANHATGVAPGDVSARDIQAASARLAEDAARVVDAAIARLAVAPPDAACACGRALEAARIRAER